MNLPVQIFKFLCVLIHFLLSEKPFCSVFLSQFSRQEGFDNRSGPIVVVVTGFIPQKFKVIFFIAQ